MKRIPSLLGLALALAAPCSAADHAQVSEVKTISLQPDLYAGWPTLARQQNGTLLLVASGGRHGHVCPFGRVEMMTSHDDGKSWTFPRTILDTALDDRDAGILETPKGTLLATTFTSIGYEMQMDLLKAGKKTSYVNEKTLPSWIAAQNRLSPEERKAQLGEWIVRSTDNGRSWSPQIPTVVNSPHGPTALADGRLLYVGKQLWTDEKRIGASESTDDGLTWRWLSEIPARKGDNPAVDYHELHAVQAKDGRIIAQIRHHGTANTKETLQTESEDGGKTWTEPHSIGVWGYPSHLMKLRDGNLLMTYGYRRAPIGNQARISRDSGRTWSAPLVIYKDATSGDLGYPSTVELADGSLLTVWYERLKDSASAVLRQAHWTISDQ